MTVDDYLKKLKTSNLKTQEIAVKKIVATFNDVSIDTQKGVKLCSQEINFYVNNMDVSFGNEMSVDFYSYEYGCPLYSYPATFVVGTKSKGFGYCPKPGWEEELKKNNINTDIIKKVKELLSTKPPLEY